MAELEQIGWDRVVSVDDALDTLVLALVDSAGRVHQVRLQLPPDYPARPPLCVAALPVAVELRWQDEGGVAGGRLAPALEQLGRLVDSCAGLFDEFDDIDANTIVLDPERPKVNRPACMARRVAWTAAP